MKSQCLPILIELQKFSEKNNFFLLTSLCDISRCMVKEEVFLINFWAKKNNGNIKLWAAQWKSTYMVKSIYLTSFDFDTFKSVIFKKEFLMIFFDELKGNLKQNIFFYNFDFNTLKRGMVDRLLQCCCS